MTKSELDYLDTVLIGPLMLFLNQYFNFYFNEYYVLWACLVSTFTLLILLGEEDNVVHIPSFLYNRKDRPRT